MVEENKQELKRACFGQQKFDFEPNTHVRCQGIVPIAAKSKIKIYCRSSKCLEVEECRQALTL